MVAVSLTFFVSSWTRKPDDSTTLTYGELAQAMGLSPQAGRTLGRQLGIVGYCCIENGLPALNSIVVNATTGVPGDWVVLSKGNTVAQEQHAVFRQDW